MAITLKLLIDGAEKDIIIPDSVFIENELVLGKQLNNNYFEINDKQMVKITTTVDGDKFTDEVNISNDMMKHNIGPKIYKSFRIIVDSIVIGFIIMDKLECYPVNISFKDVLAIQALITKMHSLDYIHNDISTTTVVVGLDGQPKLINFFYAFHDQHTDLTNFDLLTLLDLNNDLRANFHIDAFDRADILQALKFMDIHWMI